MNLQGFGGDVAFFARVALVTVILAGGILLVLQPSDFPWWYVPMGALVVYLLFAELRGLDEERDNREHKGDGSSR